MEVPTKTVWANISCQVIVLFMPSFWKKKKNAIGLSYVSVSLITTKDFKLLKYRVGLIFSCVHHWLLCAQSWDRFAALNLTRGSICTMNKRLLLPSIRFPENRLDKSLGHQIPTGRTQRSPDTCCSLHNFQKPGGLRLPSSNYTAWNLCSKIPTSGKKKSINIPRDVHLTLFYYFFLFSLFKDFIR